MSNENRQKDVLKVIFHYFRSIFFERRIFKYHQTFLPDWDV